VQPGRPGRAGIERRIEHAHILRQRPLGVRQRHVLQEALGADAGPALEDALEVERRYPGSPRHVLERGLLLIALDQVADARRDLVVEGQHALLGGRLDRPGNDAGHGSLLGLLEGAKIAPQRARDHPILAPPPVSGRASCRSG
jgi:hypothetical protein